MDDQCQLNTKISEDGLSASLIVPESFDRAMLSAELCSAMILRGGIELAAAKPQAIEQFIAEAQAAPPGVFRSVVAKGTPPKHGVDGRVEWLIDQPTSTKPAQAAAAEQTPVSFYDRSVYTVVETGDLLGQVHPPTYGEDGRDVTGKTLAARDGKPAELKHDESIMLASGIKLLAQASGVLDRSSPTISIRDTIEVDQYVDFNTGNIKFNGSVLVHKGVRDLFIVDAEQDVEVRGLIEAATIIAGNDLRALGGFAGREQGRARIDGDVYARYLDAVDVYTRGKLCIDREIINCQTTVLGQIDSPTGSLIGGETRVAGAIELAEIGADGQPETVVYLGCVPHLDPLIAKLTALVDRLITERHKLIEEQELIEKTSGGRVMAQHKERLCELMYELAEVQTQLDRSEPALAQTRERADKLRRVSAQVHRCVFPNTVLVCGGVRYRIKREMKGPLRITMDDKGRLQTAQGGGEPTMLARNAELAEAA